MLSIRKIPNIIAILAALSLLAYTMLRAYLICLTHDESGSFQAWLDSPLFDCFFVPGAWWDANLHWLYVFFMKPVVGMFGDSELAIRLPSLIAHVLYLFFSWKIVSEWGNNRWAALIGFILINFNLFLLDFFGLARGYGLSLAFMVIGVYYLGKWIKKNKPKNAILLFACASLSVLANLTALNFYAGISAVFLLGCIYFYFSKKTIPVFSIAVFFAFSGLLFFLLKTPVQGLRDGNKLYFGAKSFWASFATLTEDSLYGAKPFGRFNIEIIGGIFISLFLISIGLAIYCYYKDRKDRKIQFQLAAALLPFFRAIGTIVQHYLLDTLYLHHRTALLYWPLMTISIFFLFDYLLSSHQRWKKAIPILVSFLLITHALNHFNLTHSRPWWYDNTTKDLVLYLKEKHKGEKVSLGCNWIYHPTLKFYIRKYGLELDGELLYDKKLRKDARFDYYYVTRSDLPKIHPGYVTDKEFSFTSFLMKVGHGLID